MAALPTDPIKLMDPYATASTSTSRRPDWVLLLPSARTSDLHNVTTLVSRTRDGQPVVASFWLVDPPGVSYFSVHCPGLKVSDPDGFAHDDPDPGLIGADVVCAEAALLLFSVSFNTPDADGPFPESTHHFVYRAGPGQPALHLLPDPDVPAYEALPQFGILPCGEHYAVAFLRWNKTMGDNMFDVHVFSSQTKAWSKKVALLAISKSDKRYFYGHDTSKQITIGSSLGFVDLLRGILLLRNPFDEHPVIEYIPFPASRPPCSADDDEQGGSDVPQCFRDVACCDDLIKFVNVEYHDPSSCRPCCGRDKSWKATIWSRKLSSGDWRRGFTVDVADISLDQSYSALLPELWDDETENLHRLKKLIFYTPTLSICDDDLLYVMSKVNDEDDKAWVITVDMKNAVVQAVAPFSVGDIDFLPMYRPCSFPKYLNMTPGIDITNTAHNYFTRMDVEKCIEELLWTRDWLKELGQCLELERSVYIDCSSLHFCPVSSLRFTTPAVVEYASSVGEGKAKAASKAVDVCLRALEDFNLLLRKPPGDASTSTKAMRRKINTALKALKNVLEITPQLMMAGGTTMDGVTTLANACHQKRRKPVFERRERPGHKIEYIQPGFSGGKLFCDRRKKAGHEKDKCDELQVELNRQLELNLHGSLGPWLRSLPPDVWLILAIAFSALVYVHACDM